MRLCTDQQHLPMNRCSRAGCTSSTLHQAGGCAGERSGVWQAQRQLGAGGAPCSESGCRGCGLPRRAGPFVSPSPPARWPGSAQQAGCVVQALRDAATTPGTQLERRVGTGQRLPPSTKGQQGPVSDTLRRAGPSHSCTRQGGQPRTNGDECGSHGRRRRVGQRGRGHARQGRQHAARAQVPGLTVAPAGEVFCLVLKL